MRRSCSNAVSAAKAPRVVEQVSASRSCVACANCTNGMCLCGHGPTWPARSRRSTSAERRYRGALRASPMNRLLQSIADESAPTGGGYASVGAASAAMLIAQSDRSECLEPTPAVGGLAAEQTEVEL